MSAGETRRILDTTARQIGVRRGRIDDLFAGAVDDFTTERLSGCTILHAFRTTSTGMTSS